MLVRISDAERKGIVGSRIIFKSPPCKVVSMYMHIISCQYVETGQKKGEKRKEMAMREDQVKSINLKQKEKEKRE